ncbi:MAG: sugar phosphate nucleotidyltransferase, partial [Gammaproteobacteria bacterium]|nr:sugar phosphate nucleotidyltransferase [Gammaproteobacteria bacterium]
KEVKASHRGELEISDVNQKYLDLKALTVKRFSRGVTWLDTGTVSALLEAAQFVEVIENRQGLKVCCPEEIAWRKKFITSEQLSALIPPILKSGYGQYLEKILTEETVREPEHAL